MIYGYARVSTATQGRDGNSLEDQVAALEKYGCQQIVKEAFTGKTMDRPQFLSLLEELQEGDTLVVCKLDRFARTAIEGVQVVRELFERGIRVHILNMGLVENTLTGIKIFGSYLRDVRIHIQSLGNCVEVLFVGSERLVFHTSCGSRSEVKSENLRKFCFRCFSFIFRTFWYDFMIGTPWLDRLNFSEIRSIQEVQLWLE